MQYLNFCSFLNWNFTCVSEKVLAHANAPPNDSTIEREPILAPVCHSFWKWAIVSCLLWIFTGGTSRTNGCKAQATLLPTGRAAGHPEQTAAKLRQRFFRQEALWDIPNKLLQSQGNASFHRKRCGISRTNGSKAKATLLSSGNAAGHPEQAAANQTH